jgi:hypothetical protein
MRGIFISYRRDDAEGQAGRLFDELSAHFGRDAVFMDVAGIKKGMDFRRIIDEHVTSCGVLLVIIGKTWLSATDGKGQRRLDDANDFVRLETAVALARDIPVVPVLVHDAVMPTAQELPDVLKELAFRNGTELTHARWDSDVKLLIEDLRPYLETPGMPQAPTQPTGNRSSDAAAERSQPPGRSPGSRSLWVAAGAVVVLGGVALSGYHLVEDRPAAPERTATFVPNSPAAPPATAPVRKPDVTTVTPPAAVKPVTPAGDEPAKPASAAAQAGAVKLAADKAAADAAQAAAKAAAARKLAEDRRRREEAARLAQLAEEQRKADEQRKRDDENKRLAREKAERERIAAEQAAAASIITGIASALIVNKRR